MNFCCEPLELACFRASCRLFCSVKTCIFNELVNGVICSLVNFCCKVRLFFCKSFQESKRPFNLRGKEYWWHTLGIFWLHCFHSSLCWFLVFQVCVREVLYEECGVCQVRVRRARLDRVDASSDGRIFITRVRTWYGHLMLSFCSTSYLLCFCGVGHSFVLGNIGLLLLESLEN